MWNIVIGLGLVGCSADRLAMNAEDQSTSSMESTSTGDGDSDSDSDSDDDGVFDCDRYGGCGSRYWHCVDGECVPLDCVNDYDCGLFEVCGNGFNCVPAGEPPPSCQVDLLDIPTDLQVGEPALALSFIDLNGDGQDHLVVATETELLLYESGAGAPTIVPRDPSSLAVHSMVAGQFDGQLGEDLLLLVDADIHRYFSDGATNLVNPTVEPGPTPNPSGLIAGDFDGQPPTDLLIWGWDSTVLEIGGMTVPLVTEYNTEGAAAFPLGSPNPGLVLNTESALSAGDVVIFDLMGNVVAAQMGLFIDGPPVAIETPEAAAYVGVSTITSQIQFWSELKRLDPNTGEHTDTILIADGPKLVAADLDGDLYPELVAGGGLCTIVFDPLGDPCFVDVDLGVDTYLIQELVVGDHDGDGDEEVALRLNSDGSGDKVFLIDGG